MRNVRVLDDAADDLIAARRFYEAIQLGVGDYCADSLVADIESLAFFHGIHSIHFGCYRMLASRFPFGIYYVDASIETQVVAVLDLRRDPNWIREELTRRTG